MSLSVNETGELLDYLPGALFLGDSDGNILDVNGKVCQLLGYEKEDLLSLTVDDLVPEGAPAFLPDQIEEATRSKEPVETVNLHRDGTKIPVEVQVTIIEDDGEERILASVRDITERKEAVDKYKIMAQGSSQAIYLFQDGEFKYVNESFESLTGYSKEELKSTDFLELVHPDFKEEVANWTRQALVGDSVGLPKRVEYKVITKEGDTIWVRSLPSLVEFKGRPAIVVNAVDITREKKMERELKAEKNLFDAIMNHSPDLVYFKDEKHQLERANERYTALFGMEEEEMMGKTAKDLWPREAEEIMEDERRALNGEPVIGREREVTLPTGGKRWYSINKLPRRDADGNVVGFLGMGKDITKRKKLEQSLQKERNKLRNLHETVDRLQRQETEKELAKTAVEEAEEMLDFELCTIALVEGDKLVPRANSADLDPSYTKTFEIGEGIAGKTVQKGETIWDDDVRNHPEAKLTKESFRAFISVPIGEVGNLQVISEEVASFDQSDVDFAEILADHLREEVRRIELEREIRNRAESLEESNEKLEEMIHIISHDLKEPLRTIGTYSDIISKKKMDESGETSVERLKNLKNNVTRLKKMLDEVSNLAQVTTDLSPEPVTVPELIEEIKGELGMDPADAKIIVDSDFPEVKFDKFQLKVLLKNLIANGLKYNQEPKRVEVGYNLEPGSSKLVVLVKDNGKGIAQEHHDRVFRMFEQLELEEDSTGTGAGLALCKRIVEGNNEKIWLDSDPGVGTAVGFTVPLFEREE